MLTVDVIELGPVVAAGDLVSELVVQAGHVEMVAGDGAEKAAVLVVEGDILVVGTVAVTGFFQAPAGEGQVLDFARGQQAALEGLRQDAPVVGLQGRQFRDQGTDLQFGLGEFHLAGQAELGILVGGAAIVVGRQQAGAGAVGAGVELDTEHPQGIEAKAYGTVGVARLEVEHEALGPFVTLGLLGAGAVAKVAIEVHVTGFEARLAVIEEGGLAQRGDAGKGEGAGNCGLAGG
ncbi:hypothetical protein D3C78_934210 [compost metagenome]